ncbi:MAG: hypothetical protein LBI78_00765 [Campylobacteraceae bacterium]|nr:hypothetical protein [Campylobacteraceae bacterium]
MRVRFDTTAKAYDCTPPIEKNFEDVLGSDKRAGGAEEFLEFIENELKKPAITEKIKIDRQKQAIWGHSYSGLFVLYTLFAHYDFFQRYISVSPSL